MCYKTKAFSEIPVGDYFKIPNREIYYVKSTELGSDLVVSLSKYDRNDPPPGTLCNDSHTNMDECLYVHMHDWRDYGSIRVGDYYKLHNFSSSAICMKNENDIKHGVEIVKVISGYEKRLFTDIPVDAIIQIPEKELYFYKNSSAAIVGLFSISDHVSFLSGSSTDGLNKTRFIYCHDLFNFSDLNIGDHCVLYKNANENTLEKRSALHAIDVNAGSLKIGARSIVKKVEAVKTNPVAAVQKFPSTDRQEFKMESSALIWGLLQKTRKNVFSLDINFTEQELLALCFSPSFINDINYLSKVINKTNVAEIIEKNDGC